MAVVRVKEMDECRLAEPWWLGRQVGSVRDNRLPKLLSVLREEEVLEDTTRADKRAYITRV